MKHKHAEVLIAIAEGRDVEFCALDENNRLVWSTFKYGSITNPIIHDNLGWRVKKEPVIEVKYFKKVLDGEIIFYENPHGLAQWDIKVTFEDDKAVKAEFPKIDGWVRHER